MQPKTTALRQLSPRPQAAQGASQREAQGRRPGVARPWPSPPQPRALGSGRRHREGLSCGWWARPAGLPGNPAAAYGPVGATEPSSRVRVALSSHARPRVPPQLYEAFTFLKGLGALILVHAENGDLIAQVSGASPPPRLLPVPRVCKRGGGLIREKTGQGKARPRTESSQTHGQPQSQQCGHCRPRCFPRLGFLTLRRGHDMTVQWP